MRPRGGGAAPFPRSLRPAVALLEDGVGRAYPGAVLAVLHRGEVVLRHAAGFAALRPAERPAVPETIYDLASLTKVVVTTPLVLQAADEGRLALDDPLPRHIPESPHAGVTLRHLLAHTSGLPAWIPFYLRATGREAIVRLAAAAPLEARPGEQATYSDLGFILLGEAVARALGAPLDVLARARIFEPLGMADTTYRPPPERRPEIAPTEDGAQIEQAMAGDAGRRHTWRQTLIWGEVHDSNAHAMGGVSGHAGVFGPADDLVAYARMWLAGGRGPRGAVLPPARVREATTPQPPAAGETTRGLGWVLSGAGAWWGAALSTAAFGHTGFTGTALAVDPEHDLAIVLLSNAVHLGRDRAAVLALRPRIAATVARALLPGGR